MLKADKDRARAQDINAAVSQVASQAPTEGLPPHAYYLSGAGRRVPASRRLEPCAAKALPLVRRYRHLWPIRFFVVPAGVFPRFLGRWHGRACVRSVEDRFAGGIARVLVTHEFTTFLRVGRLVAQFGPAPVGEYVPGVRYMPGEGADSLGLAKVGGAGRAERRRRARAGVD